MKDALWLLFHPRRRRERATIYSSGLFLLIKPDEPTKICVHFFPPHTRQNIDLELIPPVIALLAYKICYFFSLLNFYHNKINIS